MSVIINTNSAAAIASNNLSASNAMLQKSLNRLSSGSKIVNASDDAGGNSVASRLSAAAKRSGSVGQVLANTVSFLQHQDTALKTVSKVLERMSEINTLAKGIGLSTTDVANYNQEMTTLTASVTAIKALTFNGVSLFADNSGTQVDIDQSGSNVAMLNTAFTQTASATSDAEGVTTNSGAIEADLNSINVLRAKNGALQSTIGYYSELNTANKTNYEAAVSRIMDVDVAEESTQLARWNTLVQAGTAMIAQANGSTQSALTLLR